VREIRAGEPGRGAVRIPAGLPLRTLPAERGERDDARVEPRVAHLWNPTDLLAAARAGDRHLVEPRAMELPQLVEPANGTLLELAPRAEDGQRLALLAGIEGQRQAEVPLPRDVPVAHVAEPVVHSLAVELGDPANRGVRVEHRLPDLVGGDEPFVDDAEDQRRMAAPADGVAVDDRARVDQASTLAELADDLVGRVA